MTFLNTLKLNLENEKKRMLSDAFMKKQEGIIVNYIVTCSKDSAIGISKKAIDILLIINENTFPEWPNVDRWLSIMPKYFTDSFSKSKILHSEDWLFEEWLYWFEPENRFWFLGELDPVDNEHLKISIVVQEHPFPVESLEVLLMKLGTSELHEIGME